MEIDYAGIGVDHCIAKGPFGKMADHVLAAVKASDATPPKENSKQVVGLEDVHARQMTKELISRNRHLEAILDSIGDGILEVSYGIIIYANAAAVSLLGFGQAELLARYFVNLFEPVDQERVKALLRTGAAGVADIPPDNPVRLNGRQLAIKSYSMETKAASAIFLLTDVTYQNRAQFWQDHAGKMAAVTGLIGGVAKDFRRKLKKMRQINTEILKVMDTGNSYLPKIKEIDRHMSDFQHQLNISGGIGKFGPENTGDPLQKGAETVLLADDDVIGRQINQLILEEVGYKIMIAASGQEALDKYKIRFDKKYNKIDLVIADLTLPDMASSELCERLKKINPKVKILMCGEVKPDLQKEADLNQDNYIQKPLNIRQLSFKLREILD